MSQRALKSYATTSLETASPTRLLDALYGRLVADLDLAAQRILAGDPEGKGAAINHAHAIVSELLGALDYRAAPDLCAELARLYDFILGRLDRANREMQALPLTEARGVVLTLRDAFAKAAESVR